MVAATLALAIFLCWALCGLALLALLRTNVRDLRISASAPILGSAITVLPLFIASNAGLAMSRVAPALLLITLLASAVVIAVKRPTPRWSVGPLFAVSLLELAVVGSPFFTFGFDWIANANGDMAFYVLAGSHLLGHGLQSPVDYHTMALGRDFTSAAQSLELRGLRPGTQIELAGVSAMTGLNPAQVYMPISLAVAMASVCGVGALTMQATRKWWAATVAAILFVALPLAAYGTLEQLLPQEWGLGLALVLFAWLMRQELYAGNPSLGEIIIISLLATALYVVASEVASSLVFGYAIYLLSLVFRRVVSWRALVRVWAIVALIFILIVNTFLPKSVNYLAEYVLKVGTSTGASSLLRTLDFGYAVVPTALPGFFGFTSLFVPPDASHVDVYVGLSMICLVLVLGVAVAVLRKGAAAGAVVAGGVILAAMLAAEGNDFGLLKLYMYLQPFVAATVAIWLAQRRTSRATAAGALLLVVVVILQMPTLAKYVHASRDPVDLRHASSGDLLPSYRRTVLHATEPVVSVGDNFVLQTLEGSNIARARVYFLGRDVFNLRWKSRRFWLQTSRGPRFLAFGENEAASRVLEGGSCGVLLPTGSQTVVNRRQYPEGDPDLVELRCPVRKPLLAFVSSSRGQPATLPDDPRLVSFWQLEPDPSFPGRTFSGFGRYALFEILGRTHGPVRLQLDMTVSPIGSRVSSGFSIPRAAVVGAGRVSFPVVGDGSARLISPPIRPQMIGGNAYVALDMGRDGQFPSVARSTLSGLWGRSVTLDPRALTSYLRDVSLVTEQKVRHSAAPTALRSPAGLANPDLEYSGIYEDGWLGARSYVVLRALPSARLVVKAAALPAARELRILLDDRLVYRGLVPRSTVDLRLPTSVRGGTHRIDLQWAGTARLSASDPRRAAARLLFVGFKRS
jgi:hypothetical protein